MRKLELIRNAVSNLGVFDFCEGFNSDSELASERSFLEIPVSCLLDNGECLENLLGSRSSISTFIRSDTAVK